MKYLGGKSRIAAAIAEYIVARWPSDCTVYLEPFVGAGSVLAQICKRAPSVQKYASDNHLDLILLWQALQAGWAPPQALDRETYLKLKHEPSSALRGFAGFGCAFGGDWFHGYATSRKGENFASQSRNSLLKKVAVMSNVTFRCCDYREHTPSGAVVYCDPPYAKTAHYHCDFDTIAFWQIMREWSTTNMVFISEYDAPSDFKRVLEIPRNQELRTNGTERKAVIDKLFCHESLRVE